jgi:zinc protease
MIRHPNRFTMVALSALLAAANSAHAADAASGTDALPAPGPARKVSIPVAQDKLLPNGLRVVVARRTATPLVSVALYVRSGAEIDPPSLAGLTDLTAGLLDQGTTTRSAPQIAEAADALGGSLGTGAGFDASQVSISVTTPKLAAAVDLPRRRCAQPGFCARGNRT